MRQSTCSATFVVKKSPWSVPRAQVSASTYWAQMPRFQNRASTVIAQSLSGRQFSRPPRFLWQSSSVTAAIMRMAQAVQCSRKSRMAMYLQTACWPARIVFRAAMRAMMRGCLRTRSIFMRRTILIIFRKPLLVLMSWYGKIDRRSSTNQEHT